MTALLETLDARFVQIYELARAERVAHEQKKGLIIVQDDVMLLAMSRSGGSPASSRRSTTR